MNGADGMETVLAAHAHENVRVKSHEGEPWKYDGTCIYICPCGAEFKAARGIGGLFTAHRAHLAQALRDAGYGDVAAAKAGALRELADEIDPTGYGWTGVRDADRFKQRLRDRADQIEADR